MSWSCNSNETLLGIETDGLGIQWQTERYWQGHEDQDEYEEVNEGFSDEYEDENGGEEGDTRWIFGNDEYPDWAHKNYMKPIVHIGLGCFQNNKKALLDSL